MVRIPESALGIRKAIDTDPSISDRVRQFEKLILQPLLEIKYASPRALELIVVIDILDDCDREEDIQAISQLLALTPVRVQIFLSSRLELSVRLGIKKMSTQHVKT